MRVKITKENKFKNITVIYKNQEYVIKNCPLFLDLDENDKRIYVKSSNKSKVFLDFTDLIVFQAFFGDSVETMIYCDYSFEILNNENCEIIIKDNYYKVNDRITFYSYCADGENVMFGEDRYFTGDLKKLIKKHRRLHFFIASGLPIYIILIILAMIFSDYIYYICIIIFLVLTLPSITQRKKFKKFVTSPQGINELIKNAKEIRKNPTFMYEPQTKIEKAFSKLFEKLFNTEAKKWIF